MALAVDKTRESLSLLPILAIFFALSIYQLHLPGLYYDEAADAVPAMQLLLGQKVELARDIGIQVGGVTFPVMVMDYVGATNTYLLLPFFKIMGIGVLSVRIMTVVAGAITILLTYLLSKKLLGRRVALMSAILLAVHPSFVFYVRQGVHVSSIMAVIALGSLLAFAEWRQSGSPWGLWLGAFLLGLGLSTKVLFLWFIVAVLGVYTVWRMGPHVAAPILTAIRYGLADVIGFQRQQQKRHGTPNALRPRSYWGHQNLIGPVGASIAFVIGAWMIIYYNYKTQGTLQVLANNARITQYGIDNLGILNNMTARIETLRVLLDGGHFWFLGGLFSFDPFPWALAASIFVVALGPILWRQQQKHWKVGWWFLGVAMLVLAQSPFTISGIWPSHLFILLPFAAIIIAIATDLLARTAFQPISRLLPVVTTATLSAGCLLVDYQYHQALSESGGRLAQSDAIYQLADYLEEGSLSYPVAMDWGIKASLQIITQGRVNPVEVFGYTQQPDEGFGHRIYSALDSPEQRYIFHTPQATVFPRYEAFSEMAKVLQKRVSLEYAATARDGTPVYLVYKVS